MNKIILRGRPTRDPEIHYFNDEGGNKAAAKFNLAVNKTFKRGEKTADFFNCVAFGRQAKTVEEYVKKGMQLLITGRMENNDYEGDGFKVYGYNLVVETIEFLDKKENNNAAPAEDADGFLQMQDDEDMPFR